MSRLAAEQRRPGPADRTRHADDLYGWVAEQVAALQAGHLDALDLANLAEELSDLGSAQYDKLESALRVLMAHMLKWDHQPERRGRSWDNTIAEQRDRIESVMRRNPSLRSSLSEAVARGYRGACRQASTEMNRDRRSFPDPCPYSWSDIMEREFRFVPPAP